MTHRPYISQSLCPLQAYQLFKARSCGADAVLLIAAVLPNKDLEYLMKVCRTLRLQCLVEVSWLTLCSACHSRVHVPGICSQSHLGLQCLWRSDGSDGP